MTAVIDTKHLSLLGQQMVVVTHIEGHTGTMLHAHVATMSTSGSVPTKALPQ